MSDKKIAKQVLDVIGGKENIENYTHCATRLRIVLKNNELVDKKATDDIPELKGYFYSTGQHQFVFGTGRVNDIYQAFESEIEENQSNNTNESENTPSVKESAYRHMNPAQRWDGSTTCYCLISNYQ